MKKTEDRLDQVKKTFARWRTSRNKQGKIPTSLWEEVDDLLIHYPISKISTSLGLSRFQINEHIKSKETIHFVEAHINKPIIKAEPPEAACIIELYRPCGSMMKISGVTGTLACALTQQFMG